MNCIMDKNIENNFIQQPNSSVGYILGVQDIIRQLQLTNWKDFSITKPQTKWMRN